MKAKIKVKLKQGGIMKRVAALFSFLVLLIIAYDVSATVTHTVKKGETLRTVARDHQVTLSDLKTANGLSKNKARPGTKLIIPEKAAKTSAQSKAKATNKGPAKDGTANAENVSHVVKKGETTKKIARRYSLTESELREMNHLTSGKVKAGQTLIVKKAEPTTHTVKKGDTLAKIARKYKTTPDQLREINALESDSLRPGQQILLAMAPKQTSENISAAEPTPEVATYTIMGPSAKIEAVRVLSDSDDISQMSMTDRLILFAKKMLHLPYRFGGNGPMGIDCSGYVQKVYSFAGIELPRSAREQFRVGETIDREELSIGDLVFFRTYASFPSHVGIYLGNNLFIHASSKSKKVTIDSLEAPYYFRRFIGAKRVIAEDEVQGILGQLSN